MFWKDNFFSLSILGLPDARARQHSWQPYIATLLNPGYISQKINWTKLCWWSDHACCWSTCKPCKNEPKTKHFVGLWPFWGGLGLAFPSSPRPRMLVPSSGPVLRRPSGCGVFLVQQKSQGLFLRGWSQLCLLSKQRWQCPSTGTGVLFVSVCCANVLQSEPASVTSMPHPIVTCRNSTAAAAHLHFVLPSMSLVPRYLYPLYEGNKITKWIILFWDTCPYSVWLNRDGVYIILLVRSSRHLLNAAGSSALSYFFKLFTHQNTNNSKQAKKAAWLQMVEGGDCFLPELNASSWAWFFSTWLSEALLCSNKEDPKNRDRGLLYGLTRYLLVLMAETLSHSRHIAKTKEGQTASTSSEHRHPHSLLAHTEYFVLLQKHSPRQIYLKN